MPVTVHQGEFTQTFTMNQQRTPDHGVFTVAGAVKLSAGDVLITISNKDTDGYVIIDAVQVLPAD